MLLTNRDVLESATALDEIASMHLDTRHWEQAVRIRRVVRRLRPLFDAREDIEAGRMVVIRKYAKRTEDGKIESTPQGGAIIDTEREAEYRQELRQMMTGETEVNVDPITRFDLDGLPLSGRILAMLGELLVDEEPAQ